MITSKSREVEKTLGKTYLHKQWESKYRTDETKDFYEQAFDYIVRILKAPPKSKILDAGCGTCMQSIRLAKRGFTVMAVDFSDTVLKKAELKVESNGMEEKIKLQRENILSLTFQEETFDYILCWGVLMHIPDLKKALTELSRVLRKGGVLIISEANMFSLQSIIIGNIASFIRFLKKRGRESYMKTPAGLEYWSITPAGKLLTRQANIRWLIRELTSNGFSVKKRVSGQFSELYTVFSSQFIKKIIHKFNFVWFKYVKVPYPAFGNILIFQKEGDITAFYPSIE